MLKVGFPHHELEREIEALRHYDGDGICRLLEADEARHAMLLERLAPGRDAGRSLASRRRRRDTIGAQVMRRLWRPVPEPPGRAASSRLPPGSSGHSRDTEPCTADPARSRGAILERAEAIDPGSAGLSAVA